MEIPCIVYKGYTRRGGEKNVSDDKGKEPSDKENEARLKGAQIRVHPEVWETFGKVVAKMGSNRSVELRRLMVEYIDLHAGMPDWRRETPPILTGETRNTRSSLIEPETVKAEQEDKASED